MWRSRKLKLTDWTSANNALMQYFEGNKSKLAKHLSMSRTTVTDFFNEKPVGEKSFRRICLALRLSWDRVSSVNTVSETSITSPLHPNWPNEELIARVEDLCRQKILGQHNHIRLINGKKIGVDQLYVDVWLLDQYSGQN